MHVAGKKTPALSLRDSMPRDFSPEGLFEQSLVNLVLPFSEGETAKNGMLLGSNACWHSDRLHEEEDKDKRRILGIMVALSLIPNRST